MFFDGKKPNATINPDEAKHTLEEIALADVVPLCPSKFGGEMVTFIKKNSHIPITVRKKMTTENIPNGQYSLT